MHYLKIALITLLSPFLPELSFYLAGFGFRRTLLLCVALIVYKFVLVVCLSHIASWQSYTIGSLIGVIILVVLVSVGSIIICRRHLQNASYHLYQVILIILLALVSQLTTLYIRNLSNFPKYRFFYVPSESMEPALVTGDNLIAELVKEDTVLTRGDVVLFTIGNSKFVYVKRILGMPGDTLQIQGDLFKSDQYVEVLDNDQVIVASDGMQVFRINSTPELSYFVKMGYMNPSYERHFRANWPRNGRFVVDPDHYFVLGDNRSRSDDSRVFGTVKSVNIIGKVCGVAFHFSAADGWLGSRFVLPIDNLPSL